VYDILHVENGKRGRGTAVVRNLDTVLRLAFDNNIYFGNAPLENISYNDQHIAGGFFPFFYLFFGW